LKASTEGRKAGAKHLGTFVTSAMGCPTTLIIKNTFICEVETEDASPFCAPQRRRRCKTEGDVLSCLDRTPTSADDDDDHDHDSEAAPAPFDRLSDLSDSLLAGGPRADAALEEIRDAAGVLAFDAAGSQLLQRALELADAQFAREVAIALRGTVSEAVVSQHAHGVLELLVQRLDADGAVGLAEELLCLGSRTAMHAFGSCLLCKLLEHLPGEAAAAALVDEVLAADLSQVICHKFGHLVALSILSHGLPRQRTKIAEVLSGDLQRFARHRFASLVLALAFSTCSASESHRLAVIVMGQAGAVSSLACHSFGLRVVRALLELPGDSEQVRFYLLKSSRRLQKDKFGVQLLGELNTQIKPVDALAAQVGGA